MEFLFTIFPAVFLYSSVYSIVCLIIVCLVSRNFIWFFLKPAYNSLSVFWVIILVVCFIYLNVFHTIVLHVYSVILVSVALIVSANFLIVAYFLLYFFKSCFWVLGSENGTSLRPRFKVCFFRIHIDFSLPMLLLLPEMGKKQPGYRWRNYNTKREPTWFKIAKHTNVMNITIYPFYAPPDTLWSHLDSTCQMRDYATWVRYFSAETIYLLQINKVG